MAVMNGGDICHLDRQPVRRRLAANDGFWANRHRHIFVAVQRGISCPVLLIAALLERLGFEGACVTDHPCPAGRWLDAGGHYAQDPFVMLSFVAALTRKLRLHTGILVLPYRNPIITARAIATLDVFSGGRVTVGVGAGYLKGEYRALGVDFDRRNELMDEYVRAMKAAWTSDEFTFEGSGYQALGNRILPRPSQKPHPRTCRRRAQPTALTQNHRRGTTTPYAKPRSGRRAAKSIQSIGKPRSASCASVRSEWRVPSSGYCDIRHS